MSGTGSGFGNRPVPVNMVVADFTLELFEVLFRRASEKGVTVEEYVVQLAKRGLAIEMANEKMD